MTPRSVVFRSRIPAIAAILVLSGLTAACGTAGLTTGTTGTPTAAYTGQPMPPALVGNPPAAQTQQTAPNAYPAGTIVTAALPPPTATDIAPAPAAASQSTTHTATSGDTLYSLSRRYGVSVAAIAAANGLTQTSLLTIGQVVVIPAPGSAAGLGPAPLGTIPATGTPTQTAAPAPTAQQTTGEHIVRAGETLYSIAIGYGITPAALAAANNIADTSLVRVGQRLVIPGATRAPATTTAQTTAPVVQQQTPPPAATNPPPAANQQVAALPPQTATDASANGTTFRWPVSGRVISDFGPKPGGTRNDGINLAVAEGTQVKAAEAGVVHYVGNEVAGFGNLILILHADNWVTAYAHNSQILVTRGQTVARGQTIALSGSTGSVTSPQVHFELRRGTVAVNPLDYLTN